MKSQLNLLNQLQELVLTRDEHHHLGDGSHMDALDRSIDDLVRQLDAQPKAVYQRLYKKDHVVMSPLVNGCCAVCGMKLPISQVQQVRLARTLQMCSNCGRILFDEEDETPRSVAEKPTRNAPRKTGIGRFSAEELMCCDLKGTTPEAAVQELAQMMEANHFVVRSDLLVAAAMERESVLSTAFDGNLAFPHVRGVEGGGLSLALGISRKGIKWDSTGAKVHYVFFSVIPVAVSAFYLRLMSGLCEAFVKTENCEALKTAQSPADLWKVLTKATRWTIK